LITSRVEQKLKLSAVDQHRCNCILYNCIYAGPQWTHSLSTVATPCPLWTDEMCPLWTAIHASLRTAITPQA